MFKKLKDKLEEEFKQGPLKFPVSVQQLAQAMSPSPSLNSLSDNNASSSVTYTSDPFNVSTDIFSIGDDDDSQDGSSKTLPLHSIDLTATSPSNMTQTRSRRSSLSSVTSEASSLFPIYENASGQSLQSDLESEMEDGMPSQIEKISKEQLYQSYKKVFNRYNKYKGRYVDLRGHYKQLLQENVKTKNVLQDSQDKALRRIAELKEQCQLEQSAKAHLEESLRNDVEDRDHMINTLKTKISLLKGGSGNDCSLADVEDVENIETGRSRTEELEKLKFENESLRKEISDLKKLKETACHLIHRCDTTIEEATVDVNNENLKRKMSELKSEIQKMKTENESLSHLLSRNVIAEEEKKSRSSSEGNLLIDLSDPSRGDQKAEEKDKKIDKLNNLLLMCKEKIVLLTEEIKSKDLIIEDKNKRFKEVKDELETNKKSVASLKSEIQSLLMREEENVLSVAENKLAIHKELESKEEQIRALTKELKTSENEFRKEKDDIIKKYEDKLQQMTEDFTRELRYKNEENEKLSESLSSISASKEGSLKWEEEFKKMVDVLINGRSYENFLEGKAAEIEKASFRLDERLSNMQKKVLDIVQAKQKELENSNKKMKEMTEERERIISETKKSIAAEHEGSLDKLNLEIKNLTRKVEELEFALAGTKNRHENEVQEKMKIMQEREKLEMDNAKMVEKIHVLETENTIMTRNCQIVETENKRLTEELCRQGERLKSAEGDNCLLERVNKEKMEAEKKLREYIEDYKKLEKENQGLESNLNKKCEKLVKDLNDSKEKIKALECDNKAKTGELERLMKSLAEAVAKCEDLASERERIRAELVELREKLQLMDSKREEMSLLGDKYERAAGELASLKVEHSELVKHKSVIEEENGRLRSQLELVEIQFKESNNKNVELENSLKQELVLKVKELETVRDDFTSQVKALQQRLEEKNTNNEELKEKVEKMSDEKTSLEVQLAKLNSEHQDLESKIRRIESECNERSDGEKLRESERESLLKECEELKKEMSTLAQKAKNWELLTAENDKLKVELLESEKSKSELSKEIKVILKEKSDVSNSLEVKLNELETLKDSLSSEKDELAAKVKALEDEKAKLTLENEDRLNVLKNEIKFMNNKFEEDIGNIEENRSVEVNELNSRLEVAEKTSGELLEKLEKITTERDEAKVAVEERDLRIVEMESCMASLKAEMDQKFNQGKGEVSERQQQEMANMITRYKAELMKREEEIQNLRHIHGDKHNSKRTNSTIARGELKTAKDVEELIEGESAVLTTAEKELEIVQETEPESTDSLLKKVALQAAEMKELKKQYKREVTELRKIISMKRKSRRNSAESPDWGGTLDNDTEHEYLRNILYEYMMGREQLVLAKVLSAIVKFDKQQTRNVLEKEQHRQTLVIGVIFSSGN